MAGSFRPKGFKNTRVPVELLVPTGGSYHGVSHPSYPQTGHLIYVSWQSFGGTEATVDGVYSIMDTAYLTTRWRPDIKANCRIKRADGALYEIKGEPENINMENRVLGFHVERVKGGA